MISSERVLHIGKNKKLEEKPPVGSIDTTRRKHFKSMQKSWKQLFQHTTSSNSINISTTAPRKKRIVLVNSHFSSLYIPKTCISSVHTNSCPELAATSKEVVTVKARKGFSRSVSRLDLLTSPEIKREKPQRNHLGVPDIFTTSLKSNSNTTNKDILLPSWPPKHICKSAQNLQSTILLDPKKLTRSNSDTPPYLSGRPFNSSTNCLKISSCLRSKMFKHEHVSQVLDHLFIGNIESSFNEPLLCKLGIDSLIDMSNVSNMQIPAEKKTLCPCLCPGETPHFRSRLIICIEDNDKEDIEQYFHEINRFIDAARKFDKKVLIFSYFGKSRAPAAAIQYLMTHESFLLRQAFNLVKNQRPDISINAGFEKSLETLERRMFPDAKPSVSIYNEYLNVADPQAIKCAWADC